MLQGRFGDTSRRPYLEGRLILPRLNLRSDISFLVDTGADRSLLMPMDGVRMGIEYSSLTGDTECLGVGGISHNFVEQAIVAFLEPQGYLVVYTIDLEIASPTPEIMDITSLLGRDILDQWKMIYDPGRNRLTFAVMSADFTIPIST